MRGARRPSTASALPAPQRHVQGQGEVRLRRHDADTASYEYALYVWLILGGEKPIVVDAGLEDVAHMNRGAAEVFSEPIRQRADETTTAQLRKFGLSHADIGHVLVTHLHFDHVDEIFKTRAPPITSARRNGSLPRRTTEPGAGGRSSSSPPAGRGTEKAATPRGGWRGPPRHRGAVGGRPHAGVDGVPREHGPRQGDPRGRHRIAPRESGEARRRRRTEGGDTRCDREDPGKADMVLPSHDPATRDRWPPGPPGAPKYTIRPIRVGECRVTNEITFQDRWGDTDTRKFVLYVWHIEGGPSPIMSRRVPTPSTLPISTGRRRSTSREAWCRPRRRTRSRR